jgi:hypothetical protein
VNSLAIAVALSTQTTIYVDRVYHVCDGAPFGTAVDVATADFNEEAEVGPAFGTGSDASPAAFGDAVDVSDEFDISEDTGDKFNEEVCP